MSDPDVKAILDEVYREYVTAQYMHAMLYGHWHKDAADIPACEERHRRVLEATQETDPDAT